MDPAACFSCAECFSPCPVSVPNEYNQNLDDRKAIYWPFAGALPNVPVVDTAACVRFTLGEDCTLCKDACGFGAIDFTQQDEDIEIRAGAVVLATGFGLLESADLSHLGYGSVPGVITTLDMERLISSTGPTGGELLINGKTPKRMALIHCAGSRTADTRNYCSGFCCMEALKLSRMARHKVEGMETVHFYRDLCLPGKDAQAFADSVAAQGARFVHVDDPNTLRVLSKNGSLIVAHGFFKESHNRMSPAATSYEGVMAAGCASGPMDIQGATRAGKAAAGEILSAIVPGQKLHLLAFTALIDDSKCTGCRICNTLCPYKAILFDEQNQVSRINEALCQGCGTCVAACPAAAIHNKHFSRDQILAEIAGVLA